MPNCKIILLTVYWILKIKTIIKTFNQWTNNKNDLTFDDCYLLLIK
jgi:hypothetical protein